MNNFKVVHINDVANVSNTLVQTLQEMGVNAELIHLQRPFARKIICTKLLGLPLRLASALKILWSLRKEKNVILHIHYFSSALFFIFTRHKLVVHAHGTDIRMPLNKFRFLVNKLIAKFADIVIYSTPDLCESAQLLSKKAIYLPNPLRIDRNLRPSTQHGKILVFAALNENKGALHLIEASTAFLNKFPRAEITFLKMGSLLDRANDERFQFVAPVSPEEIPALLANYSIVVGQQKIGALGMSEIEAMGMGLPTICYLKGHSEYKECPVLISNDSSEIVNHLSNLFLNPDLARDIGEKSRMWTVAHFSRKSVSEKLLKIYYSLY
ncbi:glycosyltransferase family 4 protein [Bdellovibrio sp. HCB-110]|uniref:glycosyltransferase family 4 protein n=1 Tax=Bdellovibrio sp. HCB-110 TaxID=3391182 RepID=UPI0039B5E3CD